MSWHIWLLTHTLILGQPCTHFVLAYFCLFNFQLSTNKNVVAVVVVVVVVVVLLPLVQKWTSGHLTNVDIFNWLCQVILWSYILMTGLLKVAKTHHLLCDVICLLSYSHVADSWTKYCKISCLHIELLTSRLCDHLVGNIVYN